jgi:dTDP-glucose 4,6-dehydratase
MKILVTGAAGFIGSNFVKQILDKTDYTIIGIDCLNYASDITNINEYLRKSNRFEFIQANIDDSEILKSLKYDVVVNFAAETHVTRSILDSRNFILNDVLATDALLRSSIHNKKLKLFIHISTSEVYGTCENNKKMTEEHPLNPLSPYAASKCGGERLVYSYGKTYGLPFTIIRPFNNYGPRQHLEKVIPRFLTATIINDDITVHGIGKSKRDYIHVSDTCDAIIQVINNKSDEKVYQNTFNIGTGESLSVNEIATNICKITGFNKKKIKHIADRPGQVDKHWCDYKKFFSTFKWKPKIKFKDGIISTFEWYLDNKKWWQSKLIDRKVRIVMPNGKIFYH